MQCPAHIMNHSADKLGKCGEEPCQEQYITNARMNTIDEELVSGMKVSAFPNPSNSYFTLQVRSDKNDAIEIRVRDINGRIVYTNRGVQRNYSFGQDFVSGMYIVEITQGDRTQIMKLIKQ